MLAANVGARPAAASTSHALLPSGAAPVHPGHGAAAALSPTSSPGARLVGQLPRPVVQERVPHAFAAGIGSLPFATVQETQVTHIAVHVLTGP